MELLLTTEIGQEEEYYELIDRVTDTYLDTDDFEFQQLNYLK